MSTLSKLLELVARRYDRPVESLSPKDDIYETLGIDSFQALDLLSRMEEEFMCEIPDFELQDITSFESLAAMIERYQ